MGKLIFRSVLVFLLVVVSGLFVYFQWFYTEPLWVSKLAHVEGVKIQPKEALEIAEPYLDDYGTFVYDTHYPLKTNIVLYRGWYHIKRTNYPAKTARYYMTPPSIQVNADTGFVNFIEDTDILDR